MDNENSNQSIVNFAFVVAAFLVYFVVAVLFQTLAEAFGPVARLRDMEILKHGVPVVSGLIVFLATFLNQKAQVFADECVTELRKVVWPSRKDTVAMTMVCCLMVTVAGFAFGVWDFFSSQLIKLFVH